VDWLPSATHPKFQGVKALASRLYGNEATIGDLDQDARLAVLQLSYQSQELAGTTTTAIRRKCWWNAEDLRSRIARLLEAVGDRRWTNNPYRTSGRLIQ